MVLVTGGRGYRDRARVWEELDRLDQLDGVAQVIEGGASGADRWARYWAERHMVDCVTEPAMWHRYGRSAGPRRNKKMVDMQPDVVLAFPGGVGTTDCVRRAEDAGLKVIRCGQD